MVDKANTVVGYTTRVVGKKDATFTTEGKYDSSMDEEAIDHNFELLINFVRRVFVECDYDIRTGQCNPDMVVPSDLCIWDLRGEAATILKAIGLLEGEGNE